MATQAQIGEALDSLEEDVKKGVLTLVTDYRTTEARLQEGTIKQATDTPARAREQVQSWIDDYDSRNGAGTGQTFLSACLTAFGSSKTLAQINSALASLEADAQVAVDGVNNSGWTWAQVADYLETTFAVPAPPPEEEFTYNRLPIPPGYTTVWGDPW